MSLLIIRTTIRRQRKIRCEGRIYSKRLEFLYF
jgi:hypothetical protein